MAKQAERREQTRATLLSEARRLFLEKGYEETTTQMILAAAGFSKGALYHHFQSKQELMEALYRDVSETAIARARARVDPSTSYLERLQAAALAWLDEIKQPAAARLLFEIGPGALGWRKAKAIEDENSLQDMTAIISASADAGEIKIADAETTARMLNALLGEAAMLAFRGDSAASDEARALIVRFLDSLRAD